MRSTRPGGTSLSSAHHSMSQNHASMRGLNIPAEGIRQLNLPRRAALRFENLGRSREDRSAFGTRCRDIEPVEAVEDLHPTRRVRMARCRGRIDGEGCFLALELVRRADTRPRQALLNFEDLSVVGRDDDDDDDVVEPDRLFLLCLPIMPSERSADGDRRAK